MGDYRDLTIQHFHDPAFMRTYFTSRLKERCPRVTFIEEEEVLGGISTMRKIGGIGHLPDMVIEGVVGLVGRRIAEDLEHYSGPVKLSCIVGNDALYVHITRLDPRAITTLVEEYNKNIAP